jgi:glycosyltransferase involved in cell wall biosynthesis
MPNGSTPTVSVAVSTHGRASLLPRLVQALERQTLPPHQFEVIVVDDGSTDDTFAVLQDLARSSSLDLRPIRLDRNAGQAIGRNAAWRVARAPIVAFTDDDCTPTPEWLETGARAMQDGPGIVVGRTTPSPDQLHLLGPFSRTMNTTDERYFATCNIFYRRDDLEAVDGFDEGFGATAGEDTDLAYRVRRLGRGAAFAPDALVHHDVRPSSFRAAVRDTQRWGGIVRMVRRNPTEARTEHLWRPHVWKDTHPPTILATLGLVFSPVFPLALVFTLPYLRLRLRVRPRTWSRTRRFLVLPGTYVIDLLEVYVMLRASWRYKTLVA